MGYEYRFSKVLKIREDEKDKVLGVYFEAVSKFERVAEKLYEYLKKKEDLEAYQSERIAEGLSIQEVQHHQQFIANLDRSIAHYQQLVINARSQMEFYREQLLEKNIEVKKYEKMKERDYARYMEAEKQADNRQMDEISIQQFVNRTN